MRLVVIALALVLALGALVAPARAEDRKKAEQHFRIAEKAFRAQSYSAAAESFELAYQELPLPEIAFSAAQAYRRLYYVDQNVAHARRAAELYRAYIDAVKTGGRVRDASDAMIEMKREVDRAGTAVAVAAAAPASTRLAISYIIEGERTAMTMMATDAPAEKLDARAMLDGKPVKLHEPIDVAPGSHVAEIEAAGFFPDKRTVLVLEGAKETIELVLRPRPAKLRVATEDGARVSIDGKPVDGVATIEAGRHLVTVERRGREPAQRELVLGRGEDRTLRVALERTGKRRAVPYVLAGAGTLALLAGATSVVALRADGRMADVAARREASGITAAEHAAYERDVIRRDRFRDATWVLGATAVATGAVGLALYYFDAPTARERVLVPSASATSVGASVVGRF